MSLKSPREGLKDPEVFVYFRNNNLNFLGPWDFTYTERPNQVQT